MSYRPTGAAPARLVAVLGPTNTGKTHLAVERMLGHASGMIGLPLRLLAREIYDRIVKARGARAVALITGEEKIVPPRAHYFVCTVEAMPLEREVEFLAVDEIQLAADPERGHVFTDRLLHARGRSETMFLGAATHGAADPPPGPRRRNRDPRATLAGCRSAAGASSPACRKRSAVVAFSAEAVYAIAELIRRQRGGAAVVMGALSPAHPQRPGGSVSERRGRLPGRHRRHRHGPQHGCRPRRLRGPRQVRRAAQPVAPAAEIGQIAGRAGRFQRDGTFGVTGEAEDIDPEIIDQVEAHAFAAETPCNGAVATSTSARSAA